MTQDKNQILAITACPCIHKKVQYCLGFFIARGVEATVTSLSIKQKDLLAKLLPTRTKISAEELNTLSCYDIDTYCPSLHGELDAFTSAEPRSSDTEERPQAPQCAQQ